MKEFLLDLFNRLPGWAKLAVFLVVLALTMGITLFAIFEHVPLLTGLLIAAGLFLGVALMLGAQWVIILELSQKLAKVTDERDKAQDRFNKLSEDDAFLWMRPAKNANEYYRSPSQRKARIIAFCNFKGGVGKTTVALNVGAALALRGKRVLLIDLDWQATLSKLAHPKKHIEYQKKDFTCDVLLSGECDVNKVLQLLVTSDEAPNLQVILAREKLEEIENQEQSRFFVDSNHEVRFFLRRLLHAPEIADQFDYVFLDTAPRPTTATINAFVCADYYVVPTSLSDADIRAVPMTLKHLKDWHTIVRATFLGAIVTSARLRSGKLVSYEKDQLSRLKKQIGNGDVFRAMIPDSPTIHKCALGKLAKQGPMDQKTVAFYDVEIRQYFEKGNRTEGVEMRRRLRMKTEEMAELLDGFASMSDKHMSKQAVKDIRLLSSSLREFSGKSVASFCKSIGNATEGGRSQQKARSPRIDADKVEKVVQKVNHFLRNRQAYDYPAIEQLVQEFDSLTMAQAKSVGDRVDGPVAAKTKVALLYTWRHWLQELKSSADEGAFHFSGATGS